MYTSPKIIMKLIINIKTSKLIMIITAFSICKWQVIFARKKPRMSLILCKPNLGLHKTFGNIISKPIFQSRLKCTIKSALTRIWAFWFWVITKVYIILCFICLHKSYEIPKKLWSLRGCDSCVKIMLHKFFLQCLLDIIYKAKYQFHHHSIAEFHNQYRHF